MRRLLIAAAFAIIAAAPVHLEAKTIRVPQKDPLFRITIPDSWTAAWESDGSLTCMPRNHSKYVSVIPSENVRTSGELKAQLSRTARDAGANAKMKDLKLSEVRGTTGSNGLILSTITAEGTSQGKPMVFRLVAFAPRKENYFTIIALEPAGSRDREIGAILSSISSAR